MKNIITCSNEKCKYYASYNRCLLTTVAINNKGECVSYCLSDYYKPNIKKIDTSDYDYGNRC